MLESPLFPENVSRHQQMSHEPIHILGVGNLGKLVAHSLANNTPSRIILLFHRESLREQWELEGGGITCITDGVANKRSGFGIEVLPPPGAPRDRYETSGIKNLIVATKTYMTKGALECVSDRVDSSSTILFLQNGMGKASPPPAWATRLVV